jgi:peptidoglycan/xylan/chitin deacetylase (PgdA/CDA1 family)
MHPSCPLERAALPKKLTLSFDNGPTPGVTELVLDELARRSLKATFFVIGQRLLDAHGKALAARAAAEGHWIGNHTMNHETPFGLVADGAYACREIGDAETVIGGLAHERKFFRPYAGGGLLGPHVLSKSAISYLAANGFTLVTWNSVPRDWEAPFDEWVPRAIADVDRLDWTLLVLHDIRPELARNLSVFLDAMESRSMTVVQEFPPDCVLMEQGQLVGCVSELVAP